MGVLGIYKNNPTAGGTDGTKVVAGNPIITPFLDMASNAATEIKLALRCDAGKKTLAPTTITPKSPTTTLAESSEAGEQAITVASSAGFQVNNLVDIGTGETKDTKRIVAITNALITLDSAMSNPHTTGEAVSSRSRFKIALAKDAGGAAGTYGNDGAALVLPFIATPSGGAGVASSTGGSLSAGEYSYKIVAGNLDGVSVPGEPIAVTIPAGTSTNKVSLTWNAVEGATGYLIYGRTNGNWLQIGTSGTTSFDDTGAATPDGAIQPASLFQIGDKNVIIWAKIRAEANEATPYKDVSASMEASYTAGDA